jgi:HK97 gp10 family phage protein
MARIVIVSNRLPAIGAGLSPMLAAVVKSAAGQIVEAAAASMEGQIPPSAPGHAPAIDSGILHGSLDSKMTGPTSAIAYTNVEYAQHLEYGTVHMEPRPFLTPAAERIRPGFEAAVVAVLRKI